MDAKFIDYISKELNNIDESGLFKRERIISTEQGVCVKVKQADGKEKEVIIFCANNYLGLSSHPKVVEAAKKTLEKYGYGMSSVRFICGTQTIHKELEQKIARFVGQ